ncbi:MAG: CoA pyrophosphatase [Bacteroidota bacterium]
MRYSPQILQQLRMHLQDPLPGWEAQRTMAPPARDGEWKIPEDVRKSAVLLLLYPDAQELLHLVLMKRSEDGRTHGGQISFPGGRWEEYDKDYVETALRETEEEVGVPQEQVEIIGQLSEIYIPPSNFMVYPSVGITHKRPQFVPDPVEVDQIIEAEVRTFLSDTAKGSYQINHRLGFQFQTPGYQVKGHTVWGATAMILAEFAAILEKGT